MWHNLSYFVAKKLKAPNFIFCNFFPFVWSTFCNQLCCNFSHISFRFYSLCHLPREDLPNIIEKGSKTPCWRINLSTENFIEWEPVSGCYEKMITIKRLLVWIWTQETWIFKPFINHFSVMISERILNKGDCG